MPDTNNPRWSARYLDIMDRVRPLVPGRDEEELWRAVLAHASGNPDVDKWVRDAVRELTGLNAVT